MALARGFSFRVQRKGKVKSNEQKVNEQKVNEQKENEEKEREEKAKEEKKRRTEKEVKIGRRMGRRRESQREREREKEKQRLVWATTSLSKRLEAETVRLTELQESLRARKEILKVAYEEIKILREDLLREGESMDKHKSHFLSPEDTEEIRILEQQELASWRGSASKRLAGWTRDGSSEEIAGWMMEAQRLNREV